MKDLKSLVKNTGIPQPSCCCFSLRSSCAFIVWKACLTFFISMKQDWVIMPGVWLITEPTGISMYALFTLRILWWSESSLYLLTGSADPDSRTGQPVSYASQNSRRPCKPVAVFVGTKSIRLVFDDQKWSIAAAFLLAVCPYYIMSARFALDCNLMLCCSAVALLFLIRFTQTKTLRNLILSGVFLVSRCIRMH